MKLSALDAFTCPQFDGKKAQNRFLALMEKHRKFHAASATKSGVSEFYSEKHEVFDDLVAFYDDFEQAKATNAAKERKKIEAKDAKACDAAMVSLGKRKSNGSEEVSQKEDTRNKYSGMVAMMAEDTDKELAFKREELQFRQKQFAASEKDQEFCRLQFLKKMEDGENEREYQTRQREAVVLSVSSLQRWSCNIRWSCCSCVIKAKISNN